jgi:S1-C subfamily serine protease
MTMRNLIILTALMAVVLVVAGPARAEDDLAPKLRAALVKVYVESQGWPISTPWQKAGPRSSMLRGVVVRPGLVLVPAGVADHIMIEVSEANSARRYPASLVHVDYGANLALVKVEEPSLRLRIMPLDLHDPITIDDEFEIWQLGGSDLLERYTGRVQQVYESTPRLMLNVKTNLSDGGNGQAALKAGKLAGLVLSTRSSRQEGQVLSVETIKHFLDDYDSGEYVGFPSGGIWTHDLLRDDLRAYFKVPDDTHGVAVSRVIDGQSGGGVLKVGDVITRISGYDLDDEGMYVDPVHGRLNMNYLLYCKPAAGDNVPATILRDGKAMDVEIPLRKWTLAKQRVPYNYYDRRPPYIIVGGLVVLELSRMSSTGESQLRQYQLRAWWDPPSERKRIVYASRVLADIANKGIDDIRNVAIKTINGKPISLITDVPEALKSPMGGFHVITFEEDETPFVIEAAKLDEINARILERYRIPELSYFGE